jgi:ribosomal protein L40E
MGGYTVMITCPECGHGNNDSAVDCANCGNSLGTDRRNGAAEEPEAMSGQLDLPPGEASDGARLFASLLPSSVTAGEIAGKDVESLTRFVAHRRRTKVAPGAVHPALTDEQIADAILDYARSAPPDLRVGQAPRAKSRKASPLGLWITWVFANELAAAMYLVLLAIAASLLQTEPGAIPYTIVSFLGWPLILGTMQWLVLKRWLLRFHEWLIPTAAGALFGSIVVYLTWDVVWGDLPALWTAIATGALMGATLGVAQWLAVRRRFSRAGWWILATTAGGALAGLGDQASDCLSLLAGSAPAALTGIALVWLVRQTLGEEAEMVLRPEMQTCPHCGEQVPSRAAVCRHCQGWLVDRPQAAVAGEKQPTRGTVHAVRHGVPRSVRWAAAFGALAALALPTVSLVARASACGPLHSSVIVFAVLALTSSAPAGALPAVLAWIMGRRRDGGTAKGEDFSLPRAVAGGVLDVIIGFTVSAVCAFMTFFPECL